MDRNRAGFASQGSRVAVNGPSVSLAEAARTTGRSVSTIRRWLASDAIPGAFRTPDGSWDIPISGLISAGLEPRQTPPPAEVVPEPIAEVVPAPSAEVERLRAELDAARDREVASLRAEVQRLINTERTLIETIERMSRALPTGPSGHLEPEVIEGVDLEPEVIEAEVIPAPSAGLEGVAVVKAQNRRAWSRFTNRKR
jgi:hypothetical protein